MDDIDDDERNDEDSREPQQSEGLSEHEVYTEPVSVSVREEPLGDMRESLAVALSANFPIPTVIYPPVVIPESSASEVPARTREATDIGQTEFDRIISEAYRDIGEILFSQLSPSEPVSYRSNAVWSSIYEGIVRESEPEPDRIQMDVSIERVPIWTGVDTNLTRTQTKKESPTSCSECGYTGRGRWARLMDLTPYDVTKACPKCKHRWKAAKGDPSTTIDYLYSLVEFQKQRGLVVDGVYGPLTQQALVGTQWRLKNSEAGPSAVILAEPLRIRLDVCEIHPDTFFANWAPYKEAL